MIGYSIMMWFLGIVLFITAVSLLKGNTSSIHGKVFRMTKDKKGFGKALGKVVLFISFGLICSGCLALIGTQNKGIQYGIIVLVITAFISTFFFIQIQRRYGEKK